MSEQANVQAAGEAEGFSLDRLEYFAYRRDRENAALELVRLLRHLDSTYGQLGAIGSLPSGDLTADQRDGHFATRIACAIAMLFADPEFQLSPGGFRQLIGLQSWLPIIFGASSLGTADFAIHVMNTHAGRDQITLSAGDLLKFCLLYSPDSDIPLQPDVHWQRDSPLAASFFLALLSSRLVVTEPAQAKREELLAWLPPRLAELSLDDVPTETLHHVWMHCSYAWLRGKHDIKRAINGLIRARLIREGLTDLSPPAADAERKPVVLCIVEWFLSGHSIYRTHSVSLEALRAKYRVVGVSLRGTSDELTRQVFDEVHVMPHGPALLDLVAQVRNIASELRPDIVYYPSVGMFPETVFLTNLRLAPVQIAALGHPATTHSEVMDYIVVEDDYLGDPQCFSERILAVPREAIPYRPPANCPVIEPNIRKSPEKVRIGVAASVMKINPAFLATLAEIAGRAKTPVEFVFFSLLANGLAKTYLQNVIQRFLPGRALVNPQLPYASYLEELNACDLFVNPFPFGNTNGIVDTVRQGLPGVCLSGPEVHSHIDEGLFKRLGLPEWTIARSREEYVTAAVRLIDDAAERERLSRALQKVRPDEVLFQGNAALFAEAVEWLHRSHAEIMQSDAKVLRAPLRTPPRPPAAPPAPAEKRAARPPARRAAKERARSARRTGARR